MAKRRILGFLSSLSERRSDSAPVAGGERGDAESSGSPLAEEEAARLAAEQVEPESDRRPADAALAELKERATATGPTAPEQRGEVASVDERVEVAAAAQGAEVPSGPAGWTPPEEDDALPMIPLVLPGRVRSPFRPNLRRYALVIGIGLALAALAAWLLLEG